MTHLDYINKNFPTRKSDNEKHNFREYVLQELKKKGIEARVEETKGGNNKNVIIGDPINAKVIFTAHYDTPARSLFPNIMIPKNSLLFYTYQFVPVIFLLLVSFTLAYLWGIVIMNDERAYIISFLVLYYGIFFLMMRGFKNPNNYNDNTSGVATVLSVIDKLSHDEINNVAFILFDNEEKGKKGSLSYFKDHKDEMNEKFLLNFDCVGNGDNVIFVANKNAMSMNEFDILKKSFPTDEGYLLHFLNYKEAQSNSDHKSFPCGVACVVCKKTKGGLLYTPHIHTPQDVVVDNGNIDYLSKNTCQFVRKLK